MAHVASRTSRDFVRDRTAAFLLWRLPALVMVAVAFLDLGLAVTGTVWALCLSVFGFGCLSNAVRCGRVHCYFTGPFFLVMAGASLLNGFGWVALGSSGWLWLGGVTLLGGIGLWVVPERIWGQYAGGGGDSCEL